MLKRLVSATVADDDITHIEHNGHEIIVEPDLSGTWYGSVFEGTYEVATLTARATRQDCIDDAKYIINARVEE